MAKDDNGERYVEGRDFEWVKAKGSNYKTRRFFSKAEKRARAEKENAAKATTGDKPTGSTRRSTESSASAPKTSPRPKPRPARNNRPTSGPDDGSRGGQQPNRPVTPSGSGVNRPGTDPNVARNEPNMPTPSQRTAFGGVPISNPNRDMALTRRREEAEARRAAAESGGRVSSIGRMVDKIFGDKEPSSGSSARRASRGMAKGGLVKANCGASMKPTQKKFRKGKK